MENQQGAGGSDIEQKEHEAGGKVVVVKESHILNWIIHTFIKFPSV